MYCSKVYPIKTVNKYVGLQKDYNSPKNMYFSKVYPSKIANKYVHFPPQICTSAKCIIARLPKNMYLSKVYMLARLLINM